MKLEEKQDKKIKSLREIKQGDGEENKNGGVLKKEER
jgi:hypothetical protein